MNSQRLQSWLLRLAGSFEVLAFFAVIMPRSWMEVSHAWLGMGAMPGGPLIMFMIRQSSYTYGMHGVSLWVLASDVVRFRTLVILNGVAYLLAAPVFFLIDYTAGMPWYWTALDSLGCGFLGGAVLLLNRLLPKEETTSVKEATESPKADEFHKRAGESRSERRKLLTGVAVGSVGLLYATLTGKDKPTLDPSNKWLALAAVALMALSGLTGLLAWMADARWAYKAGNNFAQNPTAPIPDGKPWHEIKNWCDGLQLVLFALGLIISALLTLKLL